MCGSASGSSTASHDREQRNEWTARNLAAEPAPVDDVLAVDEPVPADREWTAGPATGEYDADATVVVRYQTRDGEAGVDLVTPLVTDGGTAVLVDRGWVATDNTGAVPADLPARRPARSTWSAGSGPTPPAAGSRSRTAPRGRSRASTIGETLDYPVYAGFVDAETETPPPTDEVQRTELPDLGEGPHFFYGLQWWFFGALAVFGFGYLAWDERRQRRRTREAGHAREEPVRRSLRGPPMPTPPFPDDVRALLEKPNPAVITTLRADGQPVSVATWYLLDGDRILVNMDATRARLEHLRNDPRVALTVLDEASWYTHVSVLGRVVELHDDARPQRHRRAVASLPRPALPRPGETPGRRLDRGRPLPRLGRRHLSGRPGVRARGGGPRRQAPSSR